MYICTFQVFGLSLTCWVLLWTQSAGGQPHTPQAGFPWPATDGLNRTLPLADAVGPPRKDRFVGIFYFLWHQQSPHSRAAVPYDISKILTQDPQALSKPNSRLWGPLGAPHYWGQPLYGYYQSTDEWVLRRHAYLLADAGIDVLVFDTTNAVTYPRAYRALCEVFHKLRQQGESTPQITFMVNTKAGQTAEKIYHDLYEPNLYTDLWFRWKNKPLMICDPDQATPELQEFFTLRRAHWPFTMINTERAWHWEATHPQPYGYDEDPSTPEQVNVSVAQNLRRTDGKVTHMSDGNARGRSFHHGDVERTPGAIDYGHNFQEQWDHAIELDPPFVMVTGWNEWIASRFARPGKPIVFVDQYDQEHSRDIEFARQGHLDHYYYQMVANIRHYKGAARLPTSSNPLSINIAGDFKQWQHVTPEYRDHIGETIPRDYPGVGKTHHTNATGRNDLATCKVTRDEESVYFYLSATKSLQPSTGVKNLWLFIDTDQSRTTGWEGYDMVVGRDVASDGRVWLEKSVGDWEWEQVAPIELRQKNAELHLAIPISAFGNRKDSATQFDFKWVDNPQQPGNIQDYYLSGDVAPEGRFNYRASIRTSSVSP